MITLVEWDSENLGIKVGNLFTDGNLSKEWFEEEISEAKRMQYDLLYLKGVSLPENLLSENIFLADEKVVYSLTINSVTSFDDHCYSIINSGITAEILSLAYESGKFSRFKVDEKLSRHVFNTLYKLWIVRSLNGEIATDVLGYMEEGHCKGILTYKVKEGVVEIGLVAVTPDMAGKGIGSKLMQSFLSRFEQGTRIEVATQKRNEVACHFYEKNGFTVDYTTKIYHVWI